MAQLKMHMRSKKDIRESAIALRKVYSSKTMENLGHEIIQNLISYLPWKEIRVLHVFLSCKARKEIHTRPLLEYVWKKHPDIVTLTNRLHEDRIICHQITAHTSLEKNDFGILEPCASSAVWEPSAIDYMILPLLACDQRGFRMGYGKGYYDRLLKQCPHAKRIGINYFPPLEKIPDEAHDEPLHALVTPEKIWEF